VVGTLCWPESVAARYRDQNNVPARDDFGISHGGRGSCHRETIRMLSLVAGCCAGWKLCWPGVELAGGREGGPIMLTRTISTTIFGRQKLRRLETTVVRIRASKGRFRISDNLCLATRKCKSSFSCLTIETRGMLQCASTRHSDYRRGWSFFRLKIGRNQGHLRDHCPGTGAWRVPGPVAKQGTVAPNVPLRPVLFLALNKPARPSFGPSGRP